ncbi:nucleotidyl transferase AbiEii/AbiGii toxin family protein [Saccharicrinis sp. FJH2]|uniref:nucleotidyl transferase AbiEii/AbiGii toxin family protein n=1 Tax=Saccharicrinis sp. FJH65 TaxID=3344659 RepID=UPI0035F3EC55
MIPRRYIEEWRQYAPWPDNAQVEQDLVIERALVEIFSDDLLRENLAFRGGTALHKIFLKPQVRYSEDIDLVQIKDGPIKPLLENLRERMKFLGTKRSVKQNVNNNTVVYRFETEIPPVINLRLKIEINCREDFSVLGLKELRFETASTWFKGNCSLISYELEELLGTKLRALYQRRKGRDLFDLWWAATKRNVDVNKLLHCYYEYMQFVVDKPPTAKQFRQNLDDKMEDFEFMQDMNGLLKSGVEYNPIEAYHWLLPILNI